MSVPLPAPSVPVDRQDTLTLFTMLIWGEARGEARDGKIAVACVVRNRERLSPRFGDGYRAVILRPRQFSCFNLDDPNRDKLLHPTNYGSVEVWQACGQVAEDVYYDDQPDTVGGACWYVTIAKPHGASVWPPRWARELQHVARVGRHDFYAEP